MNYDVIVIGAGSNGLAAAVHLAQSGQQVLVVDSHEMPGGAMKTRELTLPGFRHDAYATSLSQFAGSGFFQAHKEAMAAHGAAFVQSPYAYATVFRDGTYLGVTQSADETAEAIAALSPADAVAWRDLLARFRRDAPHLRGLMGTPMPSFEMARVVWKAWRAEGTGWLMETLKLLLASPREFIEARFEHPKVRALLMMWGLHIDFAPDIAGGALFSYFQGMGGQLGGITIGKGGASTIIDAMVGVIEASGGSVILGDGVAQVSVEAGAATGVTLASGRHFSARKVIGAIHPRLLFGKLVAPGPNWSAYATAVEQFRAAPSSMMIHIAMDDVIPWRAGPDLVNYCYVHAAPDVAMMAQVYADAVEGLLPAEPPIVIGQPSVLDPSRAPTGKQVVSLNVRMIPSTIRGDAAGSISARTWDEVKEAYADRLFDIVEGYAPGFRDRVLARSIITPADLERENPSLVDGDILSGSHHLDQNFFLRPVAGWSRYRTPVRNLYLCGAATWPGAGTGAGSGFMLGKMLAKR